MQVSSEHAVQPARVGVAILNWNGAELTIPCIRSVLAGDMKPWKIVVVDNGSADGSADLLDATFEQVDVLRNDKNLGFTGGCNTAIEYLMRAEADYIWLLNNDTHVDRHCLSELLRAAQSRPDVAAVTGKIYVEDEPDRFWYAGARFDRFRFTVRHRGANERDTGQYDRPEYVPFVSGCCLFAPVRAFTQIGCFNDAFFAYCEDMDWCLRAGKLNWRLYYQPTAKLWHRVSASIRKQTLTKSGGTASPLAHYLTSRNHLFAIRLHARRPLQIATAFGNFFAARIYISTGLLALQRWDKLKSMWRGVWHGLTMPIHGGSMSQESGH